MTVQAKEALRDLSNVRDFIRWAVSRLEESGAHYGHGTDNPWDEATSLVLHALHLPWDINPEVLNAQLTRSEKKHVLQLIEQRVDQRIPGAYLTGEAWFAGLPFFVDERVLVPRSPIAELIEAGFEPWKSTGDIHSALDLCTGSGCIGIAIAMLSPELTVDLADISAEALAVANKNIQRHEVSDRVQTFEGDLFAPLGGRSYDLIVSNPPYVDAADFAGMPDEFQHEPDLGLEAGKDGLDVVRRILCDASEYLKPGGILIVEVGNSETALVEEYPEVPFFWFEFERGGHGVFMLSAEQLAEHRETFYDALQREA